MKKTIMTALSLLVILGLPAARGQDAPKYHAYAELTGILQNLASAHKDIVRLQSIGKTREGRDIWLIEIAYPQGVPVAERPGLLIAGNFEGDHLIGSEIALSITGYLLKNYPGNAEVKQRIDNSVFYLIPRVNADAAERMFAGVKADRKTNLTPRDDDNDGRLDEDGPEDLNKDGFITQMRVKAPDSEYLADPEDARLVKKADPKKGEKGVYKLYWEGIDNDGDGFINEDGPGGTDINRNFMHEYPYYKPDAGLHMISEPESRAVMDWIISHRNVAAILTFGESDNLVVAPSSAGRLGPAREIDLVRFADATNAAAGKVGIIQTSPFGFGRFGGGGGFEMGEMFFMMAGGERPGAPPATSTQAQAPTTTAGRFRFPERKPATTINSSDVDYLRAVSDKYRELTGFKQLLYVREPQGSFFQYGYYQFGVPSFSSTGWARTTAPEPQGFRRQGMMPGAGAAAGAEGAQPQAAETGTAAARSQAQAFDFQSARAMDFMQMMRGGGQASTTGETGPALPPGIDKQVVKFFDAEKIDGFVNWTKFNHPDLGEVEIGGFKPYAITNPPPSKIPELGASHAQFAVYLTSLFAKIKVAKTEVINHGAGLFRIKAEVENAGFWPTALAQGVTARAVKPTMVQLEVKPEDIIQGNPKTNFIQALNGSGGRQKFEWLIKGKSGDKVEIKVVSQKAGSDKASIVLK
jgi:murein tripeptide amidase MpaA